jgi:hypothetical protein
MITNVNASSVTVSTNDGNGTAFSSPFGCITIPLKLESFTGFSTDCKALLKWRTGVEQNVKDIEIQRSENAASFTKVGKIVPKGSNSSYSFFCDNITNGYFRLKIIDFDGHYEYSNILSIKSNCNKTPYQVLPNLINNSIEIIGFKNNDKVFIVDMLGRILLIFTSSQSNNKFDIQKLTSGMYVLQVINNGMVKFSTKLIKE